MLFLGVAFIDSRCSCKVNVIRRLKEALYILGKGIGRIYLDAPFVFGELVKRAPTRRHIILEERCVRHG